jgi:hypothetical protein
MNGWRLLRVKGPAAAEEWPLTGDIELVLGRGGVDIDIDMRPDERVSRRHARLWSRSGRYWIEDLGSRHGTRVASRDIRDQGEIELFPGDLIEVGDTVARLASPDWHRLRHGKATLDLELAPAFGFSLACCGAPLVRRVIVQNDGPDPLPGGNLAIAAPGIFEPVRVEFDALPSGGSRECPAPVPPLLLEALESRTERRPFALRIETGGAPLPGTPLAITGLAHDEWSMAAVDRITLASFVLPNHPLVTQLSHDATHALPQGTAPAEVLEAIYTHLAVVWSLAYRHEPPGTDHVAQRVRLPHQVLSSFERRAGAGTCLDLALFVAACLEQRGLQPLVAVLDTGSARHALVGCWKHRHATLEPLLSDPGRLLVDAAWVEPTGCTRDAGQRMEFERADQSAMQLLRDGRLLFAVDVAAARADGIRPMPLAGEPRWSESVERAIAAGGACARTRPTRLATVPLLIGILELPDGLGRALVAGHGRDPASIVDRLSSALPLTSSLMKPSLHFEAVLGLARVRARVEGSPLVLEHHLLLALLEVPSTSLRNALHGVGVDPVELARSVREHRGNAGAKPGEFEEMSRFPTDF